MVVPDGKDTVAMSAATMLANTVEKASGARLAVVEEANAPAGPKYNRDGSVRSAWMDPLGHANHPMVVDWCDEATSRWVASVGLDPLQVQPVPQIRIFGVGIHHPVSRLEVLLNFRHVAVHADDVQTAPPCIPR